mgnify:CR=1 FL=1
MDRFGPVALEMLELYAKASGDKNPIHLNEKAAKDAGLEGIIAHGMLIASWMSESLARAGYHVLDMKFRFRAMTFLDDVVIVEHAQDGDKIRVHAITESGRVVCTGTAWVTHALEGRPKSEAG